MARTTWLRHFVLQRHVLALAIAALGFSLGGNSTTRAAEAPQAVPAYHLEVGQELKYKQDIDSKRGEGKAGSSYSMHTDWTASVVAKNSDGSYRVLLRSAQSYKFDGKSAGRSHDSLGYCDVFPDGRVITNPTTGFSMDPTSLFPKLAENAKELAAGWQTVHGQDDARCSFKVESPPKSAAGELTIAETSKTPLDEIYLVNRKTTIDFDAHRGLMTKTRSETTQDWGSKSKSNGTLSLVSVEKHNAEWGQKLWADADRYFRADRAYDDKVSQAAKSEKDSKNLLDEAKAILTAADKDVTTPLLKEQLSAALKSHEQTAKYTAEEAGRRAKVIGKPAAAFEATDLAGKPHSLKDYKGKVVVLDFWYRGCGWCMRAIPQMKQLSAEFKQAPVAIIGMNIDPVEADAKFVVDKMGLNYATLRVDRKVPQQFGVRGYPTLVIIDPQGKVHDLHVGYSPTLQQEVGEVVRQLLAKR